ncbi:MAG: hypothetical protein K5871_08650 [Lachnospiraceae bacterium]|nr:hypothetical protein [Lachnospiraceae bacterium]
MNNGSVKKMVSVITVMMLVLSLAGCVGAKKYSIEVSENKVEIEVDEKATIEIENYDDLEGVEVEAEDEDIVKVREKNGEITITGLEEGKTNIIITAANSDDEIKIKVKVTAPEEPAPEPEPEPGPEPEPAPGPEPTPDPEPAPSATGSAEDWYGTYSGYITLSGSDDWDEQYYTWDDVVAVIGTADNGRDYFEAYSPTMDLWGADWNFGGDLPIFSFWVDLTEDQMTADITTDASILDTTDLSYMEYNTFWWSVLDRDELYITYEYYDAQYHGGFFVYIVLYRD